MSEAELDAAVNAVAMHVIAACVENMIGDEWGNYPEIGEHDWRALQDRVLFLVGEMRPDEGQYFDAYGLLERRTAQWELEH